MKKEFSWPELEILPIEIQDVITTSEEIEDETPPW